MKYTVYNYTNSNHILLFIHFGDRLHQQDIRFAERNVGLMLIVGYKMGHPPINIPLLFLIVILIVLFYILLLCLVI